MFSKGSGGGDDMERLQRNVGQIDRTIRLFIGLVLVVLAFGGLVSTGWAVLFAIVGLYQLATAALGY